MALSRTSLVGWTLLLSVSTALVVGAVVRVSDQRLELLLTAGVGLVSAPVLAALLSRRWNEWYRIGTYGTFAVFFVTLFVATVVFASSVGFLAGGSGLVTLALKLVGAVVSFAIAVWVCFYGGFWAVVGWLDRHVVPEGSSRNA